jgi:hypothetical protein
MWVLIVVPLIGTPPGLREIRLYGTYQSEQTCVQSSRSVTQADTYCVEIGSDMGIGMLGYIDGYFSVPMR